MGSLVCYHQVDRKGRANDVHAFPIHSNIHVHVHTLYVHLYQLMDCVSLGFFRRSKQSEFPKCFLTSKHRELGKHRRQCGFWQHNVCTQFNDQKLRPMLWVSIKLRPKTQDLYKTKTHLRTKTPYTWKLFSKFLFAIWLNDTKIRGCQNSWIKRIIVWVMMQWCCGFGSWRVLKPRPSVIPLKLSRW
jgi:hypothetical protein